MSNLDTGTTISGQSVSGSDGKENDLRVLQSSKIWHLVGQKVNQPILSGRRYSFNVNCQTAGMLPKMEW